MALCISVFKHLDQQVLRNHQHYCRLSGYPYRWLLSRHLANHDWVIWIDADVLFTNQSKKLEPLLENRDALFAKDIGGWEFNAGMLNEQYIVDCLSINTPPQLAASDTLLTHYLGWGEPYRSVYMADDDAMSQRSGC
jgi:uncharacterized protein YijF (DUF1287 family)